MEKEQLLSEITGQVKEQLKGFATVADVEKAVKVETDKLAEQFKGVSDLDKKLDELKEAGLKHGESIERLKMAGEPIAQLSIAKQLENNRESIDKLLVGEKVIKTMVLPTSITNNFNGQVVPGIGQYPQRLEKLINIWAQGTLQANHQRTLRYMDTTTFTNNAAARTVGASAAESAVAWTGYNLPVESISHWIPMALEMMTDYDFVEAEVKNTLMSMLLSKFESYLITGTGVAPQIYGLDTKATTFDATDFAGKFKSAGMLDLIKAMAAKIGYDTRFQATHVLLNSYDALALELEKDDFGRLIYPNFLSPNGMSIGNIKVIASELVTANTMYVGDFSQGTLFKTAPTLAMGYINTDFTERQVTLLANMDAALLIKALNAGAFYKSTSISADVAEITTGA